MRTFFYFSIALIFFGTACKPGGNKDDVKAGTGYPEIDQATLNLEASPNDPALYVARAQAYMAYEGYDQALNDLKKAIQLDSQYIEAWQLMADAYLDYYNSRMAINTLYEAAERFPTHIPTLLKLTEFQYILTLTVGAERTLDRIQTQDPLNVEAWFWRGMIARDAKKDAEAITAFRKATELDPYLIDAWLECGKLLTKAKDPLALRYFERAVQLDSMNAPAWHALAEYHQAKNDLPAAIATYRQLVQYDPHYADAFFNSGVLWLEMDSLAQAQKEFDLAIKVDPTYTSAYLARAKLNEKLGNVEDAIRDFEQALILEPSLEEAKEALDRLNK